VAVVSFTKALARHVDCPSAVVEGTTVRDVLDAYFAEHASVRHYVLDDQGAVRKHMTVFLAGRQIRDRSQLTDVVGADDEIHVMQALSGG
jgi:sulfur carrier protein ThiS